MALQISEDLQRRIEEKIASGRFRDASEAIGACLAALEESDRDTDALIDEFPPGELARLIDEGKRSGTITAEEMEARFTALREQQRRETGAA